MSATIRREEMPVNVGLGEAFFYLRNLQIYKPFHQFLDKTTSFSTTKRFWRMFFYEQRYFQSTAIFKN